MLNFNANLAIPYSFKNELAFPDFDLSAFKSSVANAHTNILFSIITFIYIVGFVFMFFRLCFSVYKVLQIQKKSESIYSGKIRVALTKVSYAFSYFNTIFIPARIADPDERKIIVNHEISHIKQLHWFDLILTEIAFTLLWFNPFVILYKNSLRLQHEYLADVEAINRGTHHEDYLRCLLKGIQYRNLCGLTNQFYCKTIKKRILMITKYQTSKRHILRYLLFVPVTGILMFMFSNCQKSPAAILNMQNKSVGINVPDISPVDINKVKLTSGYGERINPITKKKQFHYGVDLALNEGENVFATASGIVISAGFDTLKGNFVLIKHDNSYSTLYSKLKVSKVHQGEIVNKNQVIGLVGQTGLATGPHLHYEVYKNGVNVNPSDYMPKK